MGVPWQPTRAVSTMATYASRYPSANRHAKETRIASGINATLGVWLVVSPLVFGYATSSTGSGLNSVLVGAIVAFCGTLRVRSPRARPTLSWINMALGGWMALSPWGLGHFDNDGPLWNSVFVGFTIIVLAMWSATATIADRHQIHA
jgi:hypothetical protein